MAHKMKTRRKVRELGVSSPPNLWPKAVNRSDPPHQASATGLAVSTGRAASCINLMNVLTKRDGKEPSIHVLHSLCKYINGFKRENIREAFKDTKMDMRE